MDDLMKQREDIVKKLISSRLQQNLTQEELAKRMHTQRSNISRLESGKQNFSIDFLLKAADALGVVLEFNLYDKEVLIMNQSYELKLYDTTLMEFDLHEKGLEGLVVELKYINKDKEKLLPIDMELTNEGILKWLQRRVIPKNRAFVSEILKTLGLSLNDTKGIIDICKGLSLNDSYWIVPKGFNGEFSQYNLYENHFSEMLSLVAYTGIGQSDKAFTTSPELTTNGMLPKAWRFIDSDGIYLYKGGTSGAANTGNEPYSEYYASQIAKTMGLNIVNYDLEKWKGILASKCKLFTDINTSFVPIGSIIKNRGLKACMDYYSELGDDFTEQLNSMLVFDSVIYNEDRHFGNFGILRNNQTGEIISPAPIFDNGLSLFNYAMDNDFDHLNEYAKTRGPAYGNLTFESICREVTGKKQLLQLRKLIGFTFKRHPKYNLPEKRLTAIENHIQSRVIDLMRVRSLELHKSSRSRDIER